MTEIQTVKGLRLRPFAGESDVPHLVRLHNVEAEADGLPWRTTIEEMRAQVGHASASFTPDRDITVAELDGRVVGIASREAVDTTDGFREFRQEGEVDPAFRRRGIGKALLEEGLRRHRALDAAEVAAGRSTPAIFGSWASERQPGATALLEGAGFAPQRWFFEMVRPDLENLPELPMPEGLEIRPIDVSLARAVWDGDVEAFQDHWGGFDGSEEHLQRWLDNPNTDLSLWVVAFDGDEVAGGVLNAIDKEQNAALGIQRGWLGSVFTRRQWRRRGLASALIAESFRRLRDRGMTSAGLGVDGDNPSGALGLYEGLGFRQEMRSTAWRKSF
ncbi:MAG TPA: GNAT family N-acetyltransferase [Candidatus Limnocylindrales bacterium]|nr:GNAT family N-acetyltransferase [Candidatus Limnocylindrales bacterium]